MRWRIAIAAVLVGASMTGCSARPATRPEVSRQHAVSETSHTVGVRLSELRIELTVPAGPVTARQRHEAVVSVTNVGTSRVFAPFLNLQAFDTDGEKSFDWYSASGMAGYRVAAFALTRLGPGGIDRQKRWFELPRVGLYTLRVTPIAGTVPSGVLPSATVEVR